MKSILRRLTIGAATASLAVGTTTSATSAAAAPAFHLSIPAEVLVLRCAGTVYTGIAGTLKFVGREGESASGNSRFGGTGSLNDVVVTDGTHSYRAIGAWSFGGQTNANTGAFSDRGVFHIQIVGDHGPVAAVKITARLLDDGTIWFNDHADCAQPEADG